MLNQLGVQPAWACVRAGSTKHVLFESGAHTPTLSNFCKW
jgi:hypothetical protein